MTKKQKEEIDFLCTVWNIKSTEFEKEDYINKTVLGTKTNKQNDSNPLFQAKRKLDLTIKSWREDLAIGVLSIKELKEDFNHPYMDKILKGIKKGLRKDEKLTRISLLEFLNKSETGIISLLNRI